MGNTVIGYSSYIQFPMRDDVNFCNFTFSLGINLNVASTDSTRGEELGWGDLGRSSVDLWKHVCKVNVKQWAYQGAYSKVDITQILHGLCKHLNTVFALPTLLPQFN